MLVQSGAHGIRIAAGFVCLAVFAWVPAALGQQPPADQQGPIYQQPQTQPPAAEQQPQAQQPLGGQPPVQLERLPAVNLFPLLPASQAAPYTPETLLRPIPLGLAPPFEPTKWFGLQLFLTTAQEYTDNAFQTKENRVSEWRTYITPGLSLRMDRPNSSLSLNYAPTAFISDNGVESNRIDQYLNLHSSWNPTTRFRLSIADSLSYSSSFFAQGNLGSTQTGTNPYLTNSGSAEVAYLPPEGRVALSYTNVLNQQYNVLIPDNSITQTVQLDGELVNPRLTVGGTGWVSRGVYDVSSDYWEYDGAVRASYLLIPVLSGTFYGLATYHDSDRAIALDYLSGQARVGVQWTYSPTGSIELSAGPDIFSPLNNASSVALPLLVQDTSTTVKPAVVFRWTQGFRPLTVSAQYAQGTQGNFTSIQNTGVSFTRSAGVAVSTTGALFRDLTSTLAFNWVENNFQTTSLNSRAGTTEDTFNIDASLRYYILRPLSLTLGYLFTIRTSSVPTNEFYENIFRFGLSYQYDIF